MAGKKAAKKPAAKKAAVKKAAKSNAKSKAEDSSETKKPKVKSLRTEGAASNTYVDNEVDNDENDEGKKDLSTFEDTEQRLAQPMWADKMLRSEKKLAALREQLSSEKTPENVAAFVAKRIEDMLSSIELPISDQKVAKILFTDFKQHPLESLYCSLNSCAGGSVVTPTVGLELAKLCGLKRSATNVAINGGLTFVPSNILEGPNPFIIALLAGRIDVAKLIMEDDNKDSKYYYWDAIPVSCDAGRQVRCSNNIRHMSPLQLISAFGGPEAVQYLLSLNIPKQKKYDNHWTPLHFAAFYCKVSNMQVLIDEGKYYVQDKTVYCSSPLNLALSSTEWRSFAAFSLLLEKGADVNEPDGYGVTPLHLAAKKDDRRFMEALLARDVDVMKLDDNKQSPLHIEAQKGNVKALEALLARGSDINGLCNEKKSPLHYAIGGGHDAAAEFLITKGAKMSGADAKGRTPLHIAIRKGRTHIVKLLLTKGVGIGSADSYLVDAAKIGNVEVIKALIAAGASPCTEHETPPWFVAAKYDHKEAFPILLAYSMASVRYVRMMLQKHYSEQLLSLGICGGDVKNGNALHWACQIGDVESATLLIKSGANVNDANGTRDGTALHVAAGQNNVALIKLLVSNGADIQAKECFGWSPLHSAASAKNDEAMAALVKLGADLSVKTKSGKTPLMTYTSYCGKPDDGIVSLLTPKKGK